MRRVTRCKRSTAPSKAWMPNARPQWRCQAPQPRSGAPKAQGLIAALWSQHNPACRRSLQTAAPTQTTLTGAVALMATSAPAVKLHLLDGRDPLRSAALRRRRHHAALAGVSLRRRPAGLIKLANCGGALVKPISLYNLFNELTAA